MVLLIVLAQTDVPPVAYGASVLALLTLLSGYTFRLLRRVDRESADCREMLAWSELKFEALLHVAREQGLTIPLGLHQQRPPRGRRWPSLRELVANGFDYEEGDAR